MKSTFFPLIFLLFTLFSSAQKPNYATLNIPQEQIENANSIVVNEDIAIVINSQKSYEIKKIRVIKVLNEFGFKNLDAVEFYDKSRRIKNIDAKMYDTFGQLIKDFKQKDFRDQSVADGYSMLTDTRIVYLDFTPTIYPFTLVYTSDVESENTAFLPSWRPITNNFESTVKSTFSIQFPNDLGFKYKEKNFDGYTIKKTETADKIIYQAENLLSVKIEDYNPSLDSFTPIVYFGLEKFRLEGVEGSAKSWKDFGLWMNNSLLQNVQEISPETQQKIRSLVGNETDPIKKAQIVYNYVQNKSRYVSIQLGIGGWKPMLAKEVDRLGYGDCKALSNYTKALLNCVGVPAYYTIIYAGEKNDILEDFVSMQGNHAVLAIPSDNKLTFLECTSQTAAFGFEGDFTDDRNALIIKPEGGEIVKTKSYIDKSNSQKIKSSYTLNESGEINCVIEAVSKGIAYDRSYLIEKESPEKIREHYKEVFSNLTNLKVHKYDFKNDKNSIEFTEKINCTASNYGTSNGNSLMFVVNAFNQYSSIPKRYRTRTTPFEIERGFYDEDEIEISIPENYQIEAQPINYDIKDKFGEYKTEIELINPTKIIYKRSLFIKKGLYDKSDYESFRKFSEQIAKADNAKMSLIKKM